MTLKALSFIDNLNGDSRIADLGCGTGGQTMTLGRHTTGQITGLDLFPKFIDIFNQNAERLVSYEKYERQLYNKYKDFYGYVFLYRKEDISRIQPVIFLKNTYLG